MIGQVEEARKATAIINTMHAVYLIRSRSDIYDYLIKREYEGEESILKDKMALLSDDELADWFPSMAGEWLSKEVGVL